MLIGSIDIATWIVNDVDIVRFDDYDRLLHVSGLHGYGWMYAKLK